MKRLRYLLAFALALFLGGCGPLPDGYEGGAAAAVELAEAQDALAEAQDALAHAEAEQRRLAAAHQVLQGDNAQLAATIDVIAAAKDRKARDFFVACEDVHSVASAPQVVSEGHPLYRFMRDRDGDGSVCEAAPPPETSGKQL